MKKIAFSSKILLVLAMTLCLAISAGAFDMISVEEAEKYVASAADTEQMQEEHGGIYVPIVKDTAVNNGSRYARLLGSSDSNKTVVLYGMEFANGFNLSDKTFTIKASFEWDCIFDAMTKLKLSIVDGSNKVVATQTGAQMIYENYDIMIAYDLALVSGKTLSEMDCYSIKLEYSGAFDFVNDCEQIYYSPNNYTGIVKAETVNASQGIVDLYVANADVDAGYVFYVENEKCESEHIGGGVYRIKLTNINYSNTDYYGNIVVYVEIRDKDDNHVSYGDFYFTPVGFDSVGGDRWEGMSTSSRVSTVAPEIYCDLEYKESGMGYTSSDVSKVYANVYDTITCEVVASATSKNCMLDNGMMYVDIPLNKMLVDARKYLVVVYDGETIRASIFYADASRFFNNIYIAKNEDFRGFELFETDEYEICMDGVYFMPDLSKINVELIAPSGTVYAVIDKSTTKAYATSQSGNVHGSVRFTLKPVCELTEKGEYLIKISYDNQVLDLDKYFYYYEPSDDVGNQIHFWDTFNDGETTYIIFDTYDKSFVPSSATYKMTSNVATTIAPTVYTGTLDRIIFDSDWETVFLVKFDYSEDIDWYTYGIEIDDGKNVIRMSDFSTRSVYPPYIFCSLSMDGETLVCSGIGLSDNSTYKLLFTEKSSNKMNEVPVTKPRGKQELHISFESLKDYAVSPYGAFIVVDNETYLEVNLYDLISDTSIHYSGKDFFAKYRNITNRVAVLGLPYNEYTQYKLADSEDALSGKSFTAMKDKFITYILPEGDGEKVVYAQFKDSRGKVSDVMTAKMKLDSTPPMLDKEHLSVTQEFKIDASGYIYVTGGANLSEDCSLVLSFLDKNGRRIGRSCYFDVYMYSNGYFGKSINAGVENSDYCNAEKIEIYLVDDWGNETERVYFDVEVYHGYSIFEENGVKIVVDRETGYITDINTSNPVIKIPSSIDGVTVIGIEDYVISVSAAIDITTITIPASVVDIAYEAFYGVYNATLRVFEGTAAHEYALEHSALFDCELIILGQGDITGDESIDKEDVKAVSKLVVGVLTQDDMTPAQFAVADVYGNDGVVNIKDLIKLAQMVTQN